MKFRATGPALNSEYINTWMLSFTDCMRTDEGPASDDKHEVKHTSFPVQSRY